MTEHKQRFSEVKNIGNLKRLIAAISACTHWQEVAPLLTPEGKIPKRHHNKVFDMSYYFYKPRTVIEKRQKQSMLEPTRDAHKCGTPACIAGHAMLLNGHRNTKTVCPINHLEEFLGINIGFAHYLERGDFSPKEFTALITAKETVEYLTALLEHNLKGNKTND